MQGIFQAPRSLWDPSYRETSWIADYMNAPIDLLHWLRARVNAHYPGTKLAFTEWNYGGGDHISGAIASADVLGIFGRENVGLATYWPLKADESFTWAAFRVFRNFDGNGGAFGDTSISATTSDVEASSVYASVSSSNADRTVLVAINKSTSPKTAGIRVFHSATYARASVFRLSGTTADVVAAGSIDATATNAFRYSMPARSVSVLVLQK